MALNWVKNIDATSLRLKRKAQAVQSWFAQQPLVKAVVIPSILKDLGQPVLLTSLIVSATLLGVRYFGGLEKFELAAYDHLLSLRPDAGEDDRILIVGVTEADIQGLAEWPLTDQTVTQLLTKLQSYDPRVISLDIMRDVPLEPGRVELLRLLDRSTNIVAVCKASTRDYIGVPPPPGIAPEFVGFADLVIDPGGTLRRSLLWMSPPTPSGGLIEESGHQCSGPDTVLSLGLQSALYYLIHEDIYPEQTEQGELKLGDTLFQSLQSNFGGYQTIDPGGYQIMLKYQSPEHPARQVSLDDVLSDRVDPDWIRDRMVFVGYLTPQAGDDFYTPYSQAQTDDQKMPGVTIHAQSASQILKAVLDNQPLLWSWPNPVESLWIYAWALTGGMLAWYIRRPWRLSLAVLAVAGGLYAVCFFGILQAGWIPLVPPVIALGATASSTITVLNQKLKAENLRIRTELDITRRLQQMILPPEEELQAISELDIAGYMDPCDEVGGDYYDVLSYQGHLKMGIGDVTGHGLESGLIMIMVQTAVRT
ncbi:MAG: CHASE2 domain-containing protein, partial [Cyanobacteria bacterium J06632_22]